MSFNRRMVSSGLLMRENDISWQGAVEDDLLFFLRRNKDARGEITDALWGSVDDMRAAKLLSVFIQETGGFSTTVYDRPHLVFTSALQNDTDNSAQVRKRRLIKIADKAGDRLGARLLKNRTLRDGPNIKLICAFSQG